jgi:hypothetical protein
MSNRLDYQKLMHYDIENQEKIECSTKIYREITCGDIALYLLTLIWIIFFLIIYFYGNKK